jgi:hypothetical protein
LTQLLASLEPNPPAKALAPMESWNQRHDFPMDFLFFLADAPQMSFDFTYLGMSQYSGRTHAVIALEGQRRGNAENKTQTRLSGLAAVDVASGKITFLYANVDVESQGTFPQGENNSSVAGLYQFRLKRTPAASSE